MALELMQATHMHVSLFILESVDPDTRLWNVCTEERLLSWLGGPGSLLSLQLAVH